MNRLLESLLLFSSCILVRPLTSYNLQPTDMHYILVIRLVVHTHQKVCAAKTKGSLHTHTHQTHTRQHRHTHTYGYVANKKINQPTNQEAQQQHKKIFHNFFFARPSLGALRRTRGPLNYCRWGIIKRRICVENVPGEVMLGLFK